MLRPPPISQAAKYPVVAGTILLAVAASAAYWASQKWPGTLDVSFLFETVDIRRGQLWRILASVFPHVNILHLAFNAGFTWAFGTQIEARYGHLKTFLIFILFALASNGAEYAFLDGGIGLSGIGYGLFGLLWILSLRDPKFRDAIDQQTINTFIIWFFVCILLTISNVMPVANIAHGVGALSGILLALAITSPGLKRIAASAVFFALVVSMLVCATVARPWVNVSKHAGYAEGQLGYNALMADRNQEAVRWLKDATYMQPHNAGFWFNLAMAYDRLKLHDQARDANKRFHEEATPEDEGLTTPDETPTSQP